MSDRDLPLDVSEARLLRALSEELRERDVPDLDLDAIEEAVMARIAGEPATGSGAPRSARWAEPPPAPTPIPPARVGLGPRRLVAVGATLAALAAATWVIARGSRQTIPPPRPVETAAAAAGTPHTLVETGDAPATFAREGLASWTVEAKSRAEVRDEGDRILVRLDAGALTVDVVPQPVAERFVVVAGSTRVAVHGTKFRVVRGDDVEVEVERGVVVVGRVGEEGSYRLTAPSSERFTLEGRRATARPSGSDEPPRAPERAKAPPTAPPLGEPELRARVTAVAGDCFRESASRVAPNVHLTAHTTLTVTLGDRTSMSLDPPLAPDVTNCILSRLGGLRSSSARMLSVPLSLVARP